MNVKLKIFIFMILGLSSLYFSWILKNAFIFIFSFTCGLFESYYFFSYLKSKKERKPSETLNSIKRFFKERCNPQFLAFAIIINVLLSFYLAYLGDMSLLDRQKVEYFNFLVNYVKNTSCQQLLIKYEGGLSDGFLLSCKKDWYDLNNLSMLFNKGGFLISFNKTVVSNG